MAIIKDIAFVVFSAVILAACVVITVTRRLTRRVVTLTALIMFCGCAGPTTALLPVTVPITKVTLPPKPVCDRATEKTPDNEVLRILMQCVERKDGYIDEMRKRLGEYIAP